MISILQQTQTILSNYDNTLRDIFNLQLEDLRHEALILKLQAQNLRLVPLALKSKAPAHKQWQIRDFAVDDFKNYPGFGFLTGKMNNGLCLTAIDIDCQNPEVCQEIIDFCIKTFGNAPIRIGQQPKALLVYNTTAEFRKLSTKSFYDSLGRKNQVEILGLGNQFVAFNQHPITEKPYTWFRNSNGKLSSALLTQIRFNEDLATVNLEDHKLCLENANEIFKKHNLVEVQPENIIPKNNEEILNKSNKFIVSKKRIEQPQLINKEIENLENTYLRSTSQIIKELYINSPNKPYYSDNLKKKPEIDIKARAFLHKFIQIKPPHLLNYLVIKAKTGKRLNFSNLDDELKPNLIIYAKYKEHITYEYALYKLENPVYTSNFARKKPLFLASAVEQKLAEKLEGKIVSSDLIANVFYKKNNGFKYFDFILNDNELNGYLLKDFSEILCLDDSIYDDYENQINEIKIFKNTEGLGRNCLLFGVIRKWAYTALSKSNPDLKLIDWIKQVKEQVYLSNQQLSSSLCRAECDSIAKSVAEWTFKRIKAGSFSQFVSLSHNSEIQAKRGKIGGLNGSLEDKIKAGKIFIIEDKQEAGKIGGKIGGKNGSKELKALGGKNSKRSNDLNSARTLKPWEKLGISRATFYRIVLLNNDKMRPNK